VNIADLTGILRPDESINPCCTSVRISLTLSLSPTSRPWALAPTILPRAAAARAQKFHAGDAGHDGIEGGADSVLHGDGGEALRHLAFDLAGGVFFLSAVGSDGGEFCVRIRMGLAASIALMRR